MDHMLFDRTVYDWSELIDHDCVVFRIGAGDCKKALVLYDFKCVDNCNSKY